MHRFTVHVHGKRLEAPTYMEALEELRKLMVEQYRQDMVATSDEGGALHTFMYGKKDIIVYPSGRRLTVLR